MGTEQKLSLENVLKIFNGVKMVETIALDSTVSYRLGRLYDNASSIAKRFNTVKTSIEKEGYQRFVTLKEGKTEDEVSIIEKELGEEIDQKIKGLMEQEETIKIPELKLKDFEGKNIPPKFFALLGDVIKEE